MGMPPALFCLLGSGEAVLPLAAAAWRYGSLSIGAAV